MRRANEEHTVTILLVKDRKSRAIRAKVLRHKGTCIDEAVDHATQAVRDFGHPGMVLIKTDNEPALIALRDAVIRHLPAGAAPVPTPVRESESNGSVENGVKLLKGLLRVRCVAASCPEGLVDIGEVISLAERLEVIATQQHWGSQ